MTDHKTVSLRHGIIVLGDIVKTAFSKGYSDEAGQVNISEATFELVQENPKFKFAARGKVETKGKGEMEMLFVQLRK